MWDHFFSLLFSKDSESLNILNIRLWEVGAKRCLNGTSKVNRWTDRQTDTRTDISTYRKHQPRGPMLWKQGWVKGVRQKSMKCILSFLRTPECESQKGPTKSEHAKECLNQNKMPPKHQPELKTAWIQCSLRGMGFATPHISSSQVGFSPSFSGESSFYTRCQ